MHLQGDPVHFLEFQLAGPVLTVQTCFARCPSGGWGGAGRVSGPCAHLQATLGPSHYVPCRAFPSSASSSGLNSAFSFSMWKSSWFCVALVISVCFSRPSITFTWDSRWAACRPCGEQGKGRTKRGRDMIKTPEDRHHDKIQIEFKSLHLKGT